MRLEGQRQNGKKREERIKYPEKFAYKGAEYKI
jgi:hypothetical protein